MAPLVSTGTSQSSAHARIAKQPVPVINLLAGIPGLQDLGVKDWVEKENIAFAGCRAWDEHSQLEVTEVAVSYIVSCYPSMNYKLTLISGNSYRNASLPSKTVGRRNSTACSHNPCMCI